MVHWLLNQANAQLFSDSSNIIKNYKITPFTQVEINNKYGNIEIIKSNVDSVKFIIKVKISTNDSLNLETFLENIDFAITQSSKNIGISTIFKPHKTGFLPSIIDFQKLPVGENKIEVNYQVFVPEHIELKITNKFGNILINEHKAKLDVELSNGDLICDKLHSQIIINLQFGDGKINQFENGSFTLRYVYNLELGTGNYADIDSKSSKIQINKLNVLKLESKRDKISLSSVDNCYSNLYFSNMKIDNLLKILSNNSKNSEIVISNIAKDIQNFQIQSSKDICQIKFKKNAFFNFDIINEEAELQFPEKKFIFAQQKDSLNEKRTLHKGFLNQKTGKTLYFNLLQTDLTFIVE
jgi:hypothetical protein